MSGWAVPTSWAVLPTVWMGWSPPKSCPPPVLPPPACGDGWPGPSHPWGCRREGLWVGVHGLGPPPYLCPWPGSSSLALPQPGLSCPVGPPVPSLSPGSSTVSSASWMATRICTGPPGPGRACWAMEGRAGLASVPLSLSLSLSPSPGLLVPCPRPRARQRAEAAAGRARLLDLRSQISDPRALGRVPAPGLQPYPRLQPCPPGSSLGEEEGERWPAARLRIPTPR